MTHSSRRDFLGHAGLGLGAAALGGLGLQLNVASAAELDDPQAPRPPHFPAKARSVIWLHMLEFRIQGSRHIAENVPVPGSRAANIGLSSNERPGSELLFRRSCVLRRVERLTEGNIALRLRQQAIALGVQVVGRAAVALHEKAREVGIPVHIATVGRRAGSGLRRG